MKNTKKYKANVYPINIYISLKEDLEIIEYEFMDIEMNSIKNLKEDTNTFQAFTMPVMKVGEEKYSILIYFEEKPDLKTLVHESSHAAKYCFEYLGIDMTVHEPFEYMIEWIASCCDEFMKD